MQRISKIVNEKIKFENITSWVDLGTGNGKVVTGLKWNNNAKEKIAIEKYPQPINGWSFVDELDDVLDTKRDLFTSFDCIEHITREDGIDLINKIDNKFKYKLFFTPRGFLKQDEETHPELMKINPWQKHLSGWDVEDFEKFGYKVIVLDSFHKRPAGHKKDFDAIIAYKID
jgi:hypothetical protein